MQTITIERKEAGKVQETVTVNNVPTNGNEFHEFLQVCTEEQRNQVFSDFMCGFPINRRNSTAFREQDGQTIEFAEALALAGCRKAGDNAQLKIVQDKGLKLALEMAKVALSGDTDKIVEVAGNIQANNERIEELTAKIDADKKEKAAKKAAIAKNPATTPVSDTPPKK